MAITLQQQQNGSCTVDFAAVHSVHATITSSGADAFEWVLDLHRRHPGLSGLVIGLAVEQRTVLPSSADQRRITLLQLSVDRQCLIFQIVHADWIPFLLRRLLESRTCRFVSVDAAAVVDRLWREYELVVRNTVDLGELAAEETGLADLRRANVFVLAREVAGIQVYCTGDVTSPWDQHALSTNQIVKACADAFLASQVGRRLLQ